MVTIFLLCCSNRIALLVALSLDFIATSSAFIVCVKHSRYINYMDWSLEDSRGRFYFTNAGIMVKQQLVAS
jgi:hypothetical protein